MPVHSRLALGLCGLALAAPVASPVGAALADEAGAAAVVAANPQPAPAPQPHQHKGLLGRRHCVECQRAYVKAHDGVDIPPPPGYPGGLIQGGTIVPGSIVIQDAQGPGYAVVGGPGSPDQAGYAVVGGGPAPGAEPTPIGVAKGTQYPWADPRMAAMPHRPGAGPYDPAVMPSSLPPPQTAMNGPGHDRPHLISHLFGLPKFGSYWRERDERRREQHASIAYDQPNQQVKELPASVVYGRSGH
jgi:hypothetical protein